MTESNWVAVLNQSQEGLSEVALRRHCGRRDLNDKESATPGVEEGAPDRAQNLRWEQGGHLRKGGGRVLR